MRVQGDDWWEQGIHHGDLLVVDRAIPPSTGSWVIAVLEGEFALRRVGRNAQGRRVLQSACPGFPIGFWWSAGLPNLGRGALGYTPTVAGAAFILIRDWCSLSLSSLYSNSMRR